MDWAEIFPCCHWEGARRWGLFGGKLISEEGYNCTVFGVIRSNWLKSGCQEQTRGCGHNATPRIKRHDWIWRSCPNTCQSLLESVQMKWDSITYSRWCRVAPKCPTDDWVEPTETLTRAARMNPVGWIVHALISRWIGMISRILVRSYQEFTCVKPQNC